MATTPTPIAKRFDANKLYQQASRAFTEAGTYHLPKKESWIIALAGFAQASMSLREYAIMTVEDIEPVWSNLRAVPKAVDVLTYAVADLTMVMEVSWDEVAAALAEAQQAILSPTGALGDTAVDVPFYESFATEARYLAILRANRWLMMLMLLRRSGVFNLVNRQAVSEAAAPKSLSDGHETMAG